jgi:1-acyl-sn-glycerol-3-phosphate acyltransferase
MLRKLLLMAFLAFWTTFLMPIALLAMLVRWNTSASIWIARRLWSPPLLWRAGAHLQVQGQEHVDPHRPTIYASNHQSTLDIPALLMAIPVDVRFVAKKELARVPVIGWYMRLAGFPFVDRSRHAQAIRSLDDAADRIRRGTSIVVYPEGTRSEDGQVLPFKKGPFALALKAGVPICPVSVEGSRHIMPKNSWAVVGGTIKVKIGAPMDTAKFAPDDREGLARAVRDAIIAQNLELGGRGGDREDAIAAPGKEGIGRAKT